MFFDGWIVDMTEPPIEFGVSRITSAITHITEVDNNYIVYLEEVTNNTQYGSIVSFPGWFSDVAASVLFGAFAGVVCSIV